MRSSGDLIDRLALTSQCDALAEPVMKSPVKGLAEKVPFDPVIGPVRMLTLLVPVSDFEA